VELRQLHKRAFVQGAAKKQRQAGWHVHIVAKGSAVRQYLPRLNKIRFMNRNTGIITAAVPVIPLGAIQESIASEKDFWAVYSHPEFPILS
jgi:hypothetical protein